MSFHSILLKHQHKAATFEKDFQRQNDFWIFMHSLPSSLLPWANQGMNARVWGFARRSKESLSSSSGGAKKSSSKICWPWKVFYVKIMSFQRHNQHGAARGRRKPFHIDDFLSQSVSTLRLYVKISQLDQQDLLRSSREITSFSAYLILNMKSVFVWAWHRIQSLSDSIKGKLSRNWGGQFCKWCLCKCSCFCVSWMGMLTLSHLVRT